jgi:hypothetical protein
MQISSASEVKSINKLIREHFGIDGNTGMPRYRISWSDSEREDRYGTFEIWYGSIFLRTEEGVRNVPKYPYIKQRWILEKLFYLTGKNPEIQGKFTFEPLFTFESNAGDPLPVIWDVCKRIIDVSLQGPEQKFRNFTAEEEAAQEQEAKHFEEMIGEDQSELGISFGEGVSFAGLNAKPLLFDANGDKL